MKSLYNSYNMEVEKAYINYVKGSEKSENLLRRCIESCKNVDMPCKPWEAYNGIEDPIKEPDHLKDHSIMKMVRLTDHYMTRGEVANFLTHISLWSKCIEIDQPIVILEHDAVMVKPYFKHEIYNSICYLGCQEQYKMGWSVYKTPPHGTEGPNYHFICRSHAYAIDPAVARHLLTHVLKYGISISIDVYMRADIFPIHQLDIFAYDEEDGSIISNRPNEGRPSKRNDFLEN